MFYVEVTDDPSRASLVLFDARAGVVKARRKLDGLGFRSVFDLAAEPGCTAIAVTEIGERPRRFSAAALAPLP